MSGSSGSRRPRPRQSWWGTRPSSARIGVAPIAEPCSTRRNRHEVDIWQNRGYPRHPFPLHDTRPHDVRAGANGRAPLRETRSTSRTAPSGGSKLSTSHAASNSRRSATGAVPSRPGEAQHDRRHCFRHNMLAMARRNILILMSHGMRIAMRRNMLILMKHETRTLIGAPPGGQRRRPAATKRCKQLQLQHIERWHLDRLPRRNVG